MTLLHCSYRDLGAYLYRDFDGRQHFHPVLILIGLLLFFVFSRLFVVATIKVRVRLLIYFVCVRKLEKLAARTFCKSAQVSGNVNGERASGNVRHPSLSGVHSERTFRFV